MRLEGLDPEPDPPPEDGELGYTSPLEGGITGLEYLGEPDPVAPGQVTLEELLEERNPTEAELRLERDPQISTNEELGLAEPYPTWEPR